MSDDLSVSSLGLFPTSLYSAESTNWSGITSNGLDSIGNGITPPAPNTGNTVTSTQNVTTSLVPPNILAQLNGLIGSQNIVPTSSGYRDLGSLTNSGLTDASVVNFFGNTNLRSGADSNSTTFTGTDLKLLIECTATGKPNNFKQLIECHTISVSSYRMKTPVRATGYTNPKGFARGLRTIAGTMVLTEMSVDILLTFLQAIVVSDNSKDSQLVKTDQLPAFNITMVFANEEGYASYRTILGVEFLNDGTVYSVQDMLTERTISWMAADFTPLLPLNVSTLFVTNGTSSATKAEQTPADLMATVGD